ncbi:MAG: hypothetical protein ABJF88_10035 [Rhodothermales bacterium]
MPPVRIDFVKQSLLLAFLLLAACSASQGGFDWPREPLTLTEYAELFADVEPAQNEAYGRKPEDAIRIGRYGPFKGIQASSEMIARLRKDGQPLEVVTRTSMYTVAPDSSSAQPAPQGPPRPEGVVIVDSYLLTPVGTSDTLRLYFDPYHVAPLRVPQGLEWAPLTEG